MERPIKFRGKRIDNGKFVYGWLIRKSSRVGVHFNRHIAIFNEWDSPINAVFVEPESVAQLVGYDANGNEVYEGDALISVDGDYEDTAKLISNVCDSDKLKEA